MGQEIIEIMLIEDNQGDVFLTKKAFEKLSRPYRITAADNAESAMDILRGKYDVQGMEYRPHLVLLDINLPGRDGKKILAEIKGDAKLRRIPVIVLSSSRAEQDVLQVYNDLASAYIPKPQTIEDFRNVVQAIESFWLSCCILPCK